MGSAEVLFLDGPLAGRTRAVWATPDGTPNSEFRAFREPESIDWRETDLRTELLGRIVVYRIKPNRLSHGPKWVGAIGEKVGEQLCVIQTYGQEFRDLVGAAEFDEHKRANAEEGLQRLAATEGLVAVEINEVWRGTREEAREQQVREGKPLAPSIDRLLTDELLASLVSVVFVVHEAVAMPAPVEAVAP